MPFNTLAELISYQTTQHTIEGWLFAPCWYSSLRCSSLPMLSMSLTQKKTKIWVWLLHMHHFCTIIKSKDHKSKPSFARDHVYTVSCDALMTKRFFNCHGFNMNSSRQVHRLRVLGLHLSDSVWRDHENLRKLSLARWSRFHGDALKIYMVSSSPLPNTLLLPTHEVESLLFDTTDHEILPHNLPRNTETNNHGLNPLKPWNKISSFFFELFVSSIWSLQWKAVWIPRENMCL